MFINIPKCLLGVKITPLITATLEPFGFLREALQFLFQFPTAASQTKTTVAYINNHHLIMLQVRNSEKAQLFCSTLSGAKAGTTGMMEGGSCGWESESGQGDPLLRWFLTGRESGEPGFCWDWCLEVPVASLVPCLVAGA